MSRGDERGDPISADEFEYEESPYCSDDDESSASRPPSPRAARSTGTLRDGRRFAAIFCSPKRVPLEYHREAEQMLEAGVLNHDADLSQGATLATLEALMNEVDPHILWFVGHGDAKLSGQRTLCWTTESGDIQLLDPRTCADLLLRHIPTRGGSLECVVTNSCCTASDSTTIIARLHAGGLPVAIGWSSKVLDVAGPSFALGFLRGLQQGSSYSDAFALATAEVTKQMQEPDGLHMLKTASNPHIGVAASQRFELVDPDSSVVVQPAEVTPRGNLHPKWLFRVRQGQTGEGRIAVGVPVFKEREVPHPFGVPLLPPNHLQRPEDVQEVLKSLCNAPRSTCAPGRTDLISASILGVHGMGGLGKTVLAQLVCGEPRVRHRFPDGVMWLTVGQDPNIVALQTRLRDHVRNYDRGTRVLATAAEGRDELSRLLSKKACLLVLDDVWARRNMDDLVSNCFGSASQILVTTRNADQFSAGTAVISLKQLSEEQSRQLLLVSSGLAQVQLGKEDSSAVMTLIRRCRGLPLAVCITGALVDGSVEQLRQLGKLVDDDRERLRPLARSPLQLQLTSEQLNMPSYAHKSVTEAVELSLKFLPTDTQQRLLDLAIYPEDAVVPVQALALRWCHDADFASAGAAEQVRRVLRLLCKRSLVSLEGDAFRLHDLVRDYLKARVGEAALRLQHLALLELYRARSSVQGVWVSVPRDGYIHEHLEYHIRHVVDGATRDDTSSLIHVELAPFLDFGSDESVELRTQTRQLKKYRLLQTRRDTDAQLWQSLLTSTNWEERYDAIGLTLGMGREFVQHLQQTTGLQQLRKRVCDCDAKVAARAIEILDLVRPGCLAEQRETLTSTLRDTTADVAVRLSAMSAIGKLPRNALRDCAGDLMDIISKEDDGEVLARASFAAFRMRQENPAQGEALQRLLEARVSDVREAAVSALRKLDAATLALHAPAIVARLEHPESYVRETAVSALGKLDAATLAQYATAIVARLEDSDSGVRQKAAWALGQLDAATLAQHAPAIVARLEDSDSCVRQKAVSALGKLDAATLAQHAHASVARLEDSDRGVRQAAVSALGKLDAATLAQPAPATVAKLEEVAVLIPTHEALR